MKLQFLGGAGTVTGSRYLLSDEKHRLLVDCGMYQSVKNLRNRNWATFPVEPSSINVDESIELNTVRYPCIIISANGGRVLHHLKTLLSNLRNSIVFAGFQAPVGMRW